MDLYSLWILFLLVHRRINILKLSVYNCIYGIMIFVYGCNVSMLAFIIVTRVGIKTGFVRADIPEFSQRNLPILGLQVHSTL